MKYSGRHAGLINAVKPFTVCMEQLRTTKADAAAYSFHGLLSSVGNGSTLQLSTASLSQRLMRTSDGILKAENSGRFEAFSSYLLCVSSG